MHGCLRVNLALLAAAALVLAGPVTKLFAAIALDNDVGVSASQGSLATVDAVASIDGAPRLVTDLASAESVTVHLASALPLLGPPVITVAAYETGTLRHVCGNRFVTLELGKAVSLIPEGAFDYKDCLDNVFSTSSLIFTLEGRISVQGTPNPSTVKLTVRGAGHEVVLDRIGDDDMFKRGHGVDIPTRSMDLVNTLARFDSNFGRVRGAELDEGGANRPVGFTHSFPAPGERLHGATLHIRVESNRRSIANDYILLDGGIGRRGRPRPPRRQLFLCHILGAKPVPGEAHLLEINLAEAKVAAQNRPHGEDPCDSPPQLRNLTALVEDGELNVLVANDSRVDFSDLSVTLFDENGEVP